jgi:hypothetical protein
MAFSTLKTTAGAIGIAAAGILTATTASANPDVVPFGHMASLSGAGGSQVTDYTVGNIQPSGHNDGVWFADVTAKSAKGTVTPIIGDFNARGANGATYTVLEGTNPDGLSNQPIAPGGSTSGRIYFTVGAGTPPDSVVYSLGDGADQLIWKG